jgi:hypothetical protein
MSINSNDIEEEEKKKGIPKSKQNEKKRKR